MGALLIGARGMAGPGEEAEGALATSLRVAVSAVASFFSIWGGWSVVLCLPSVQGSMARKSSKVRTRGLQHFQPGEGGDVCVSSCLGVWA